MIDLVTGASGFIGSRLIARLRGDGDRVRALLMPGEDDPGLGADQLAVGDITDRAAVERAVAGARRVYHLAAVVTDWGDDDLFVKVNLEGTRHVLDAAAAAGCQRVVLVSSIAVYGWQMHTTVCDETTPRQYGVSPYSRTKRAAEELALDYHAFGRVPVTIVRPGNVFGPGSAHWVDYVLWTLRSGFGTLVDGGRGDAALAYVDNVVDVLVRAAAAPHAAGRIYNATDGGGVTWRRYFEDLAAIGGASAPRFDVPAGVALALSVAFEGGGRLLRRQDRPLLTREAATLLASRYPVPPRRAIDELGYQPLGYPEAMQRVADYVNGGAT